MSAPALADVTPTLGQVTMTAATYCPAGTAEANGALLDIRTYASLYSLYGTRFGGNGRNNFALPDLRGRTPVHRGNGIEIGQRLGSENSYLSRGTMPAQSHRVEASNRAGTLKSPDGADLAEFAGGAINGYSTGTPGTIIMASDAIGTTGRGDPIDMRQPYVVMRYCIATSADTSAYPFRN